VPETLIPPMSMKKTKSINRCAARLFDLLDLAGRSKGLTPQREKAIREELAQLSDRALSQALHKLYRLAEADAHRRTDLAIERNRRP